MLGTVITLGKVLRSFTSGFTEFEVDRKYTCGEHKG